MSGYVNPLKDIRNLIAERIDQGVDFSGSGNILAMGNGTVIETGGGGWPGGPFMSYRLTDGPEAGHVVYIAENIRPLVKPGDAVTAGQPIASMFQGGTGIEMGWANDSGTSPLSQTAAAGGISGANLPADSATAVGHAFDELLVSLGVAKAPNFGAKPAGKVPAGLTSAVQTTKNPPPASTGGGGIFSFPADIVKFFTDANTFVNKLIWLATPSNWVRIVAFIVGVGLILFAVHALIAAGNNEPLVKLPSVIPVPV